MKIVVWEGCKVLGEYTVPGGDIEINVDPSHKVLYVNGTGRDINLLEWK